MAYSRIISIRIKSLSGFRCIRICFGFFRFFIIICFSCIKSSTFRIISSITSPIIRDVVRIFRPTTWCIDDSFGIEFLNAKRGSITLHSESCRVYFEDRIMATFYVEGSFYSCDVYTMKEFEAALCRVEKAAAKHAYPRLKQ